MAIADTVRAAELFAGFNVPLSGCIVNRVLPGSADGQDLPDCLKSRLAAQEQCLKTIGEAFPGRIAASVPEMEKDVAGLAMIEKVAAALF